MKETIDKGMYSLWDEKEREDFDMEKNVDIYLKECTGWREKERVFFLGGGYRKNVKDVNKNVQFMSWERTWKFWYRKERKEWIKRIYSLRWERTWRFLCRDERKDR